MMQEDKKKGFDYYIYVDYSERLAGYITIKQEKIKELLPGITKLHHYKDIKHKKAYLEAIKKVFKKNKIEEFLFGCKIKELKDNLLVFVEILDFVKKHDSSIFISVDDNQLIAFSKLLEMVDRHDIQITKESRLKKGSVEHRLSLIIDTMLNIERVRRMSK